MPASFLTRYPDVRLILNVECRVTDLPFEAADLVIWAAETSQDSDRIARHVLVAEAWTEPASADPYADLSTTWSYRIADRTMQ